MAAGTVARNRYERELLRDRAAEMTAAIQRYGRAARAQGHDDLAEAALKLLVEAHGLFDENWDRTRGPDAH